MKVVVYSKPGCKPCADTKDVLTAAGVPFEEHNVAENREARSYVMDELGFSQAPVVEFFKTDNLSTVWSGVKPEQLKSLVDSYV